MRNSLIEDLDAFCEWLATRDYSPASINSYRSRVRTVRENLRAWPPKLEEVTDVVQTMPRASQSTAGPAWNLFVQFAQQTRAEALPYIPRHSRRKKSPEETIDTLPVDVCTALYHLRQAGRVQDGRRARDLFAADVTMTLTWEHVSPDPKATDGVIRIESPRLRTCVTLGLHSGGDVMDEGPVIWLARFRALYAYAQGHDWADQVSVDRPAGMGGYDPLVPLVPLRPRSHEPSPRWRVQQAQKRGADSLQLEAQSVATPLRPHQ